MAKWYGVVGFVKTIETEPDVHNPQVTEKKYYGEVLKNSRRFQNDQSINDTLMVDNDISVISDDFMLTNMEYMTYITYQNIRWKIKSLSIDYPRIRLSLGGIYNGPTPGAE